eukprot:ctg_44.g20
MKPRTTPSDGACSGVAEAESATLSYRAARLPQRFDSHCRRLWPRYPFARRCPSASSRCAPGESAAAVGGARCSPVARTHAHTRPTTTLSVAFTTVRDAEHAREAAVRACWAWTEWTAASARFKVRRKPWGVRWATALVSETDDLCVCGVVSSGASGEFRGGIAFTAAGDSLRGQGDRHGGGGSVFCVSGVGRLRLARLAFGAGGGLTVPGVRRRCRPRPLLGVGASRRLRGQSGAPDGFGRGDRYRPPPPPPPPRIPQVVQLEQLQREVVARAPYLSKAERERVLQALRVAHAAHWGQVRKSGEPFITHPVAVMGILADMRMDVDTLIAGLLHDAVEDTEVTFEVVERLFGHDVRNIVESETKVSKIARKMTPSMSPHHALFQGAFGSPASVLAAAASATMAAANAAAAAVRNTVGLNIPRTDHDLNGGDDDAARQQQPGAVQGGAAGGIHPAHVCVHGRGRAGDHRETGRSTAQHAHAGVHVAEQAGEYCARDHGYFRTAGAPPGHRAHRPRAGGPVAALPVSGRIRMPARGGAHLPREERHRELSSAGHEHVGEGAGARRGRPADGAHHSRRTVDEEHVRHLQQDQRRCQAREHLRLGGGAAGRGTGGRLPRRLLRAQHLLSRARPGTFAVQAGARARQRLCGVPQTERVSELHTLVVLGPKCGFSPLE